PEGGMKLRFWRKDPPALEPDPGPEGVTFPATPYAGLLMDLLELGLTAPQVVYVVHRIEVERAKVKVELNRSAANANPVREPAETKPRVVTRNQRVPKKRNRAKYMRDYRAGLRVVTRDGDAA